MQLLFLKVKIKEIPTFTSIVKIVKIYTYIKNVKKGFLIQYKMLKTQV